ncbi:helix-turn-helix domain-containing protein [Desertivirga arenae]|uniref:helix-turn-helix domain-containing protein n=1 Tax=Desertivirga arenae TaxID=2810309 RepID=UPI001A975C64|nr:helix-turn-helix domain-containing protein [Pedobacter sp. SYSU D00823]
MIKFYDIILFIGLSGGLMLCSILFFKKTGNKYLGRLLAISLLLITLYFIVYESLLTRLILQVPALYSVAFPFYYLIPPVCYLYVQGKLEARQELKKSDLLHFIPGLLACFDLIPFYLQPESIKFSYILSILDDVTRSHSLKMGFLSPSIHFHLRLIQAFVYLGAQVLALINYNRNVEPEVKLSQQCLRWLTSYTCLVVLIYVNLFVLTLDVDTHLASHKKLSELNGLPMTFIAFSFLGIVLNLFFTPEILYGFNTAPAVMKIESPVKDAVVDLVLMNAQQSTDEEAEVETEKEQALLSPKQLSSFVEKLESQLEQQELYREQKLIITGLAAKVDIPPRTLSYILNTYYQKRYTDFINQYRVNYVISRFEKDDWRGMTLEGLAFEAGFSSRSTFFTAFKKCTGNTPSEYLEQITAMRALA